MGSLGQHEHQGEEVGQPEIVGCDGRVLLFREVGLVHITPGSLALQLGLHVGGAVDPTIGPGMGAELIQSIVVVLATGCTSGFVTASHSV